MCGKKSLHWEKKLRKKYAPTTTVFETATFGLLPENSKPNALPLRHVANWLKAVYSATKGWTIIYAQKPTNTNTAAPFYTVATAAAHHPSIHLSLRVFIPHPLYSSAYRVCVYTVHSISSSSTQHSAYRTRYTLDVHTYVTRRAVCISQRNLRVNGRQML